MTKAVKRKRARRSSTAEARKGTPTPDPVIAAINQHRTALLARWAAFGISKDLGSGDAGYKRAEAHTNAAWDREHKALKALVACQPTTIDGLLALLAYVGEPEDGPNYEFDDSASIIVGAFEAEHVDATEWSRRLSRTAKRLMDAEIAGRKP
jgi:hypothetical protein